MQNNTIFEFINADQWGMIRNEAKEYKLDFDEEVKNIIAWINEQPHLPRYLDNENKIRNYLYGNNFSLERTKRKLDLYYSIRPVLPEFFRNRDPTQPNIKTVVELGHLCALPKLTKEGYRILYGGFKTVDLDRSNIEDFYKMILMTGEPILAEDFNRGVIMFADADKVTIHMFKMFHSITLFKKLLYAARKCYPLRLIEFHAINVHPVVETLGNQFVKPFVSKKLLDNVYIHSKEEGYGPLLRIAGSANCPVEFGGSWGSLQTLCDASYEILLSYRDWFLREETRQADESKRPMKTKDTEELFGMAGSFRKLTVD